MLAQAGEALAFWAYYTASKQGKTGLTVTCDVWTEAGTHLVTAGTATEIGGGLYKYALAAGSNTTAGGYAAVFKTTDSTVDTQWLPALWVSGQTWVTRVDAATSSRSTYAGGAVASVTADVGITQAAADKVWSTTTRSLTDKIGFALSAAGVQAVWDALTSALTTAGSVGKRIADNLDAAVSSRMATFTYTTPPTTVQVRQEIDANSTRLDANISTRLATSGYTAPDNTSIGTILTRTDVATSTRQATLTLPSNFAALLIDPSGRVTFVPGEDTPIQADVVAALTTQGLTTGRAALLDRLDAAVSTRLAASAYTAPLSAGGTANAVWDAPTSAHATAGSTGAQLVANGASADPLLNAVPGTYPAGSAGYVIGHALVGAVTVVSPVLAGGALDLYAGAAYTTGGGNALVWVLPGTAPDLTGAALAWHANDGSAAQPVAVSGPRSAQILTLPLDPNPVGVGHYWRWEICATGGSLGTAHPVVVLAGDLAVHPLP